MRALQLLGTGERKGEHLSAWTDIKIPVALGLLDLCSLIGETEAQRMNTCKAMKPRKDTSKTRGLLYSLGTFSELGGKNLPYTTLHPDLWHYSDKGVGLAVTLGTSSEEQVGLRCS